MIKTRFFFDKKPTQTNDSFVLVVTPPIKESKEDKRTDALIPTQPYLSADEKKILSRRATAQMFKGAAGSSLELDLQAGARLRLAALPKENALFFLLGWAKEQIAAAKAFGTKELHVDLTACTADDVFSLVDALTSALYASQAEMPAYGKKQQEQKKNRWLIEAFFFYFEKKLKAEEKRLSSRSEQARLLTAGTNLVRQLQVRGGNDLTCKSYRTFAEDLAHKKKLKTKFYDYKTLKKMGAGCFAAVAQGSPHEESGILEITYDSGHKKARHIALVGKGIVYDTGGVNVKPGTYMFGTHADMAGSAVALALIDAAKKLNCAVNIKAYLAINDNLISPEAYKPNDIVLALNGTAVEVVHTDAEGRMILSDTLTLACREKPDIVIDFATLTGSCIAALGTRYCGAFTNRSNLFSTIIASGESSGERVWPFPLSEDFAKALDSEIADIKQCRLKGGPDHIEAAYFLKQFLENDPTWIHIDLSSAENEGGLAHVPTDHTGFGVRLGWELIARLSK